MVSSIIQILGYTATGFQLHPWNAYLFIVDLIGWFIGGVLWNDRAIMLIHLVAFSALLSGIVTQGRRASKPRKRPPCCWQKGYSH